MRICKKNDLVYSVVIRTLGTAGEKYQRMLDSLMKQTIAPEEIIVYIAEGYPIPKETCGKERYVYVKKGMMAQRALRYDEVKTEYVLFLDDDVYLPEKGVEQLYRSLVENDADVVAPELFYNNRRSVLSEMMMTVSGRMRGRRFDKKWGNKVMKTAGFSYNQSPKNGVYLSQTNAGPCFFCKKEDFLKIRLEEELWIDKNGYAIGDDQVMFYKMHLMGLKQLTLFGSGIVHLDAGSTQAGDSEREKRLIGADFYFKRVFWHRFIYLPEQSAWKRLWAKLCIEYAQRFGLVVSAVKGNREMLKVKREAIKQAKEFIRSEEYKALPRVERLGIRD